MRNFAYLERSITTITESARKLYEQQQQLIKLNCQLKDLTNSTQYNDVLHLFNKIRSLYHPLKPDHYTLSTTLTACANLRNTTFGTKLHAYSIKSGFKAFPHVSNTLLLLYAKVQDFVSLTWVFGEIQNPDVYAYTTFISACTKMGHVNFACEMFDKMPKKEVAVWNAMITGCIEGGNEEIGFGLFRDMCRAGVRHDNYSVSSILTGYDLVMVDFGLQVHSLVIKTGSLVKISIVNALVTMYFNRDNVQDAYLVFQEAGDSVYNQITYNVMIDGLVSRGRVKEALIMFRKMLWAYCSPTELTFVSFMSSCLDVDIGYQFHAQTIKMGFEACTSVSNATITMYSNCGDLDAAYMVFEKLENKDLISWNTMISGYAQGNLGESAILAYLQMRKAGITPNEFTFGSLLSSLDVIEIVEMIHALVFRNSLLSNIQVSNALISAYSKFGNMEKAHQIFCNLSLRNLISWNAIISSFLCNGLPVQGLEQFSKLLMSKLRPNEYTLSIILSICASISAFRQGKQIHGYIMRLRFSSEGSLGNALITMYAKCGLINWSLRVFTGMTQRDVVSWNALISGYAQHGKGNEAVHCFEAMQQSHGVQPDETTFKAILSACSHAGLVDDGIRIFNSMVDKHGVVPGIDHLSCIVDLLGRAGYFDEVERIMNSEYFKAHPNIWWILLSACAAHDNLMLGRLVARFLLETEQDNPSVHVLLSKMYAAIGQWEEAANVRCLMDKTMVMKLPGYSWIGS